MENSYIKIFLGLYELLFHGNLIYCVAHIARNLIFNTQKYVSILKIILCKISKYVNALKVQKIQRERGREGGRERERERKRGREREREVQNLLLKDSLCL